MNKPAPSSKTEPLRVKKRSKPDLYHVLQAKEQHLKTSVVSGTNQEYQTVVKTEPSLNRPSTPPLKPVPINRRSTTSLPKPVLPIPKPKPSNQQPITKKQNPITSVLDTKKPRSKPWFAGKFSRAEKTALVANAVIWTLVIWAALIYMLVQDGPAMWVWLNGTQPVQAAPLPAPTTTVERFVLPPTASPTNTRVVPLEATQAYIKEEIEQNSVPVIDAATSVAPSATPVVLPSPTPLPQPTVTNTPLPLPSPTDPPPTPLPIPTNTSEPITPATATTVPAVVEVEEAAFTVPQPDIDSNPTIITEAAAVVPTPVPWPPPADPPPRLTERQQALMPTQIVIDSVGINSGIISVGWHTAEREGQLTSVWEVAEYAVGWHQNSALPGDSGNMVLSAHSNVSGEVFRPLPDVSQGDIITVYVDDQPYNYQITHTTIVKEAGQPLAVRQQNAQWIAPSDDERLTLVTCWPYPHSTHRFIVVAKPIL